jgi:hypothetical protein
LHGQSNLLTNSDRIWRIGSLPIAILACEVSNHGIQVLTVFHAHEIIKKFEFLVVVFPIQVILVTQPSFNIDDSLLGSD